MRFFCSLFLALFLFLHASSAWADSVFCSALQDRKSYKGFSAYEFLVPGKEGWAFISEKDFQTEFDMSDKTLALFQNFQTVLRNEKGTEFVLVLIPPRGLVHADQVDPGAGPLAAAYDPALSKSSWKAYIEKLRGAGLNVASLTDFKNIDAFAYSHDHHWNAAGAKRMAEETGAVVKAMSLYKSLPRKDFVTEKAGKKEFPGSFNRALEKICGSGLPSQKITEYLTRVKGKHDKSSLFGDEDKGASLVTLVGTSYSGPDDTSRANFAGYLREALQTDVQNAALDGGGIASSILSYLSGKTFQETPPKLLIWEVPGFYSLERKKLFRQMSAAVHGDCPGLATHEKRVEKTEKRTALFGGLSDIKPGSHTLFLKFDEPVKGTFRAEVLYEKGDESFKFQRVNRYPGDGLYTMDFDPKKGNVRTVVLSLPPELQGKSLTARLCAVER